MGSAASSFVLRVEPVGVVLLLFGCLLAVLVFGLLFCFRHLLQNLGGGGLLPVSWMCCFGWLWLIIVGCTASVLSCTDFHLRFVFW